MAKIIKLEGWQQLGDAVKEMYLNADHIRTIDRETKGNSTYTVIYTESYNSMSHNAPIYTNLDIQELVKLINE